MRRAERVLGALVLLACGAAGAASAQSGGIYTIDRAVVSGGGGLSTGGASSVAGTAGQPAARTSSGGIYELTSGFWALPPDAPGGLRGDANGDGTIDVTDVFFLINHLFANGPAPKSTCLGDANGDSNVDVLDVFYLINHLFAAGPAPPPPAC